MKLLFLCKRRPMGRDLLTSPYGRFYYLPQLLARKGHDVTILLCSYKREPDAFVCDADGINWYSASPISKNPLLYYQKAQLLARDIKPDWVVGFSDTYYGIIAQYLAGRYGSRSLIDAYDNYESYIPWCKPLHNLWRRALAKADLVTAAGPQLAELMGVGRSDKKPTVVLPMAADPIGFKPLDKIKCRQELGLPLDKKLVGYCGSIHPSRGIDLLFDAYNSFSQQGKAIELVLSGKKGRGVSIPDGVRWLGYLPDNQIPGLLNSMDVLTVINKASAFGNYSYPVKLYEAMCCQVPVVACATASSRRILSGRPDLLVKPGNSADLGVKIIAAMQYEKVDYGQEQGWDAGAAILEKVLKLN